MAQTLKYSIYEKDSEKHIEEIVKHLHKEFKAEAPHKDSKYSSEKKYNKDNIPKYLEDIVDKMMKLTHRDSNKYNISIYLHHRKSTARYLTNNKDDKDIKFKCVASFSTPEVYKCLSDHKHVYFLIKNNDVIISSPDNNGDISMEVQNKVIFRFNNKVYCRSPSYVRFTIVLDIY